MRIFSPSMEVFCNGGTDAGSNKKIDPESLGNHYGLEIWHRSILSKNTSELSIRDISTMIRQDLYADIAIPIAWDILHRSPFEGEMWDGQLLALIADYYEKHDVGSSDMDIGHFLDNLDTRIEEHEWDNKDGAVVYRKMITRLVDILEKVNPNLRTDH